MFVRITSALAVFALVVGAASGCGSKSSNTLKVGDIVPLTGDLAPFGPSGEKAARLAVNQANAAGLTHLYLRLGSPSWRPPPPSTRSLRWSTG